MEYSTKFIGLRIPPGWRRSGLVVARRDNGYGQSVVGDPCIVWDEELSTWRMFLFYDPPGHGHALCRSIDNVGRPGNWESAIPLDFTNPAFLIGGSTHKPFVVMDAGQPNVAARINGRYCLASISILGGHKIAQCAWANSLAGPWTWDAEPLIGLGGPGAFDEKHVDAISGYYFADRGEILWFYMGYPEAAQDRLLSPHGSAQGVAQQTIGEAAVKLGEILPPSPIASHWASGWVGGLQLMPGQDHRWIAMVNASPTAPNPDGAEVFREEPPPSLGGWAICDEEFPVSGWRFLDEPIEWILDIPQDALNAGEGYNLWRHHVLALPYGTPGRPAGALALFYNSGYYGQEQLYVKFAEDEPAR